MMSPKEIAEARRLFFGEHWRIGTIATHLGRHPDAVKRALQTESFTRNGRYIPRLIDPYVSFIEDTLESYPRLRATRMHEMIVARGYKGSVTQTRREVKRLRPATVQEAYLRLKTLPGEQGQVDWGEFGHVQIGKAKRKLSAFVMVLSWSRGFHVIFTLDEEQDTFQQCHIDAFEYFGGVPRVLLYDNLKSAVLQRFGDATHFNSRFLEFAGHYHFEPRPVAKGRGNEKGRVERAIRFLRDRFFAARHFKDVDDLNEQFLRWREEWAHKRPCPENKELTVDEALTEERGVLMGLPEHPFPFAAPKTVRSGKTPYVRFDLNDYSIPFELIRKPLTILASRNEVRILNEGTEVARHLRSYDKGETIEDEAHISALVEMKRSARQSREMTHVMQRVAGAKPFLEAVVERGENLTQATRQLERLLDDYGEQALSAAVAECLERGTTAPSALAQILEQERRKQNIKPPVNVPVSEDPRVRNLRVNTPKLGDYDDLAK